ncbi:MAG: suppressor of fused domain protein [Nannocystaceae bacterium]
MSNDVTAPGWEAIDRVVSSHYLGQTPHQYASKAPYEQSSASPLPAITAWQGHADTWHLVTYGLSELFDKTSEDPEVSGFGFELTLSIVRRSSDEQPPPWAVRFLQALGKLVFEARGGLDTGHCIDLGAPLDANKTSSLVGVVCVPDPVLGKITTPNGSVLFLRLIGLTRAELEIFEALGREASVLALASIDPRGITDLHRKAWLQDEQKLKIIRRVQAGLML